MQKLENIGVTALDAREAREVNGGLSFNDALNSVMVVLGLREAQQAEVGNCVSPR